MDENNIYEVDVTSEGTRDNEDLQAKLEEAGSLSEKACIAIGALALAGTVALGNCAWKGGKKAVGWVKGKLADKKAKKADKAEDQDQKPEEGSASDESKKGSKK